MSVEMTEFKLSFRGQRRRFGGRVGKSPLDEMAEQIRSVDDAAQRASRRLHQSARKLRASNRWHPEAGGELLAELAETLVARADGIRTDCGQLSALLDRATRLVDESGPDRQEPGAATAKATAVETDWAAARAALEAPALSAWQGPGPNGLDGERPASDGVRLIATQMAIAGSTRAEIQDRLHDQFGIDDVAQVLDEVFGEAQSGVS